MMNGGTFRCGDGVKLCGRCKAPMWDTANRNRVYCASCRIVVSKMQAREAHRAKRRAQREGRA
jgi:uncharacterized Zn finger protein (UPF0148 family)